MERIKNIILNGHHDRTYHNAKSDVWSVSGRQTRVGVHVADRRVLEYSWQNAHSNTWTGSEEAALQSSYFQHAHGGATKTCKFFIFSPAYRRTLETGVSVSDDDDE